MINLSKSQVVSTGHTLFSAFIIAVDRDAVMRRAGWPENIFIWCEINDRDYAELFLVKDMAISIFEPAPDDYNEDDWIVISAE